MAKIRHIAIKVEDQEKTAEFYKKTFGMTEAWRALCATTVIGRSISPTAISIWRSCPRAAAAKASTTLAFKLRTWKRFSGPHKPQEPKARQTRNPATAASPKWACTIPRANWSM
jgi:hypothetical protein